jgi:hypothetical protein
MPLTTPPQIRVVYAEYNSPPAGTTAALVPDTFYDRAQDEITGGPLAAALAALGLTYASGIFTALFPITLAVSLQLDVDPSPGGADYAFLSQPDFLANPNVAIAHPNTIGTVVVDRSFAMVAGQEFKVGQICAVGTDTPLDYAALSIVRLI